MGRLMTKLYNLINWLPVLVYSLAPDQIIIKASLIIYKLTPVIKSDSIDMHSNSMHMLNSHSGLLQKLFTRSL